MFNPFFYIQAISLALSQIWVNKARSFLTAARTFLSVLGGARPAGRLSVDDRILREILQERA